MRPDDLSEFSYGYAVTEELVHRSKNSVIDAPYFPSLIKEGRTGGGYDLALTRTGGPAFIQFKLCHCMTRRRDNERTVIHQTPFYRMYIRTESRQHDLLSDLEELGNSVFYVAPAFHTSDELRNTYLSKEVLRSSIFIRPSRIGRFPDDEKHYVAFQHPKGEFYRFSDPVSIGRSLDVERFDNDINRTVLASTDLMVARIDSVCSDLLRLASRYFEDFDKREVMERIRQVNQLQQVAYLARNFFGCETLIASPQDS